MRLVLAVIVVLPLVTSCAPRPSATDAKPALTERQRDSLIARSSLPGAGVVGRAMQVSDAATESAAAKDEQVEGDGSN